MNYPGIGNISLSKGDTVKLGVMTPLSGLVKLYGEEITRAGQIAADEINSNGGVLGKQLELIIVDDGSQPETAIPAALRLVTVFDCKAIIGNLLSNSRIAVNHQVAEPYQIPYLNFSFYEGSIYSKYFFHFAALPNQQIDKMIPYMASTYGPKFFFAGTNYEWPRGSINAALKVIEKCKGEVVGEEYLDFGISDFTALLSAVSRSGADVFVPYFAGLDQLALLTQFTEFGLKKRMAVVMGHYDEAMMTNLPAHVKGGFYSSNTYFMSIDSPTNKQFLNNLSQMPDINGIWPEGNGVLTNFGEGVYLCVKAYAKAVNQAGSTDSKAVIEKLETISVTGPQGTVTMDKETHHAKINSYLAQSQDDGTFKIIQNFGAIAPKIPERYLNYQQTKINRTNSNPYNVDKINVQWRLIGIINCVKNGKENTNNKNRYTATNEQIDSQLLDYINTVHSYIKENIHNSSPIYLPAPDCINGYNHKKSLKLSLLDEYEQKIQIAVYVGNDQQELEFKNSLIELTDSAIIVTNTDGIIIQTNGTVTELFGYSPDALIGHDLEILIPPKSRHIHREHFKRFITGNIKQKPMSLRSEISGYRCDGSEFPAEASIAKSITPEGMILVSTIRDISKRKQIEKSLTWQANHDALTGLANRALINNRLNKALERSKRTNKKIALLFVDIDNFKTINDSFGHCVGDKILVDAANRLLNSIRPGDLVGRFGGDEFLVLCDSVNTDNDIPNIINNITQAMKPAFHIDDHDLYTTVSIGVAYGDGNIDTPELLLKNADTAMYSAKDKGRDRWQNYHQSMEEDSREYLTIASGLRNAIKNNEFHIVLQPIIEVTNNHLSGAEILLRWKHKNSLIPPEVFIPIAEMTGIIHSLGNWVLEQACRLIQQWKYYFDEGKIGYLSINISAIQASEIELIENISKTLNSTKINYRNLLIEVTETAIMSNEERSLKVISELGNLGIKLAIDDFGTGYSSLGKLLQLPVDHIKIDRVFIQNLHKHKNSEQLIKAIISMANALELKVIAEGVETEDELNIMKKLSCDFIQGYYYSTPLSPDQFQANYLSLKAAENSAFNSHIISVP